MNNVAFVKLEKKTFTSHFKKILSRIRRIKFLLIQYSYVKLSEIVIKKIENGSFYLLNYGVPAADN